jgi:hypothetical protein
MKTKKIKMLATINDFAEWKLIKGEIYEIIVNSFSEAGGLNFSFPGSNKEKGLWNNEFEWINE